MSDAVVVLPYAEAAAIEVTFGRLLREAAVARRPIPNDTRMLWKQLQLRVATSRSGQSSGADVSSSKQISTSEAATILGWHERRVRRHARDLDAATVAGRLVYDEHTVREYAKAIARQGEPTP